MTIDEWDNMDEWGHDPRLLPVSNVSPACAHCKNDIPFQGLYFEGSWYCKECQVKLTRACGRCQKQTPIASIDNGRCPSCATSPSCKMCYKLLASNAEVRAGFCRLCYYQIYTKRL